MSSAFLTLGGNVAPRQQYLRKALQALQEITIITSIAPLYESEAYGERDQPAFLNSAVLLQTDASPRELLAILKEIEAKIGRKQRYRWGPREIDLDIIFYDQQIVSEHALQIPHPDFRNRRFVLQPLVDLNPDFSAPDTHQTLQQLLDACPDQSQLRLINANWYTAS